jgi:predicted membrane protein
VLSRRGGFSDLSAMLSIAAFMFSQVIGTAASIFVAVFVLSRRGGFSDLSAMLSIAAFMFSLVIGTAASLLTRRILRRR